MDDSLEEHYQRVSRAILQGSVVPLLGAGVNLCGRPEGWVWEEKDSRYLPDGSELARFLASSFGYPPGEAEDLVRVSQYAVVVEGSGPLYKTLHDVFDGDYPPGPLHRFLASLPPILRGRSAPHQLIATTNYDQALEQSFAEAGEEFDVVSYIAVGDNRGKFSHRSPDGTTRIIEIANQYSELSLERRTVILKVHGEVDRSTLREGESFVITEDDYIDYLTHTDPSNFFPVTLAATLKTSHFLFLGYGLRDWNLRVILRRIWGEQRLTFKSWAVQLRPSEVDSRFWKDRDVEIKDVRLEDYVEALSARIVEGGAATAPP